MGHGALVHPYQRGVPLCLYHRGASISGVLIPRRSTVTSAPLPRRSTNAPLQKWSTYVFLPKPHRCTRVMEHQCAQTLKRAPMHLHQRGATVASVPIAKRSIDYGASIPMRSIGAPLQKWSTDVFLAKRTLVHMGHGTLVLLNQ